MIRKVDAVVSIAMTVAVVVMFWFLGLPANADKEFHEKENVITLVYVDSMGSEYPAVEAAKKFAKDVEEQTRGSVRVLVSNGARSEKQIKEMLEKNEIDMARLPCNILAKRPDQKLAILSLPFMYESNEHKWKVLQSEIGVSALEELSREQGLIGLAWMEEGERVFYSNVRFMKETTDAIGLSVRVQNESVFPPYWKELGAMTSSVATSKTYYSMKTKHVNSADNNWIVYGNESHYEMAPLVTSMRYWFIPELVVISKSALRNMPAREQYIVMKCAEEAGEYQKKLFKAKEMEAKQRAIDGGAEIVQLTGKERQAFKQAAEEVYRNLTSEHKEMISRIEELAAE